METRLRMKRCGFRIMPIQNLNLNVIYVDSYHIDRTQNQISLFAKVLESDTEFHI